MREAVLVVIFLVSIIAPSSSRNVEYIQPEQVHLSIGDSVLEIVVTWVTLTKTKDAIVEYGKTDFKITAKGTETEFVDGGKEKRKIYIHRVKLTKLHPLTRYVYHCGGHFGWSDRFSFKTMRTDVKWAPRFALFGDLGNRNGVSIPRLQEETQQGHFDMILHVGDFAYDMYMDNARVGDEFMRQVESFAAYVPYMTCPGNHEEKYNFSNYKARFTMPGGDGLGNFYSFNVGPVHFIYYNLEYFYFPKYGQKQIGNQYSWLKKDLQEANKKKNRAKHPWIIAMAHRPMYCSNTHEAAHCPNVENMARVGLPVKDKKGHVHYKYGLEDLFYQQGVDMIVAAHEHSYERMWPVYNRKVCKGAHKPYVDPPAPVHIVTGSAGCPEHLDNFRHKPYPWSAFHDKHYGYTRMQVFNATHLYFEQLQAKTRKVVDSIWVVKKKHGAGSYSCHHHKSFV